jgi:AcrR family transcriptional regulator
MAAKKASSRPAGRPRSEVARRQILDAAYRLLQEKGIQAASTQEIAAQAGVSTATLYRWWDTKEAIMLDAAFEHIKPLLAYDGQGSPLARLREQALRGVQFASTEDGRVITRLIAAIHESDERRQLFLERFYLPRRALAREVVVAAIRQGELPADTDPEILIDALHGPQFFRMLMGHAPIDMAFVTALVDLVLGRAKSVGA